MTNWTVLTAAVADLWLGTPGRGNKPNAAAPVHRRRQRRQKPLGERIVRSADAEIRLPCGEQNAECAGDAVQRMLRNQMRGERRTAPFGVSSERRRAGDAADISRRGNNRPIAVILRCEARR